MFNLIMLVVVTLNGQIVATYERNGRTTFDSLEECRAMGDQVNTTFNDTGNFVFNTNTLCVDRQMMEAHQSVRNRAVRVGDKAVEILEEMKLKSDQAKYERRNQQRQQPQNYKQQTPQRNYLTEKQM